MKKYCYFFILAFLMPILGKAQFIQNDSTTIYEDGDILEEQDDIALRECYSVLWNLNDFHGNINQNCPPKYFSAVVTRDQESLACKAITIPISGYPKVRLYFAGILADELNYNPSGQYALSGDYADFNLDMFFAPADYPFRVEVIDYFGNIYFTETRDITLQPTGATFSVEEAVGIVTVANVCELESAEIVVCQDDDITETITIKKTSTSLSQTSINVGFNVKVGGEVAKIFNISAALNASQTYTMTNTAVIQLQTTLPLPPPEDEICVYPGLTVKGREYELNTYEFDCAKAQYELIHSEPSKIEIFSVKPKICETPWRDECVNPNPIINTDPNDDDGGGNLVAGNGTCTGNIYVTLDQTLPPDEIFTFFWEGPNGFVSFDQNLINVPFGTYYLSIHDGCGNFEEYEVFLCDATVYGDWTYSDISGPFCRTRSCGGGDSDCDLFTDTECVYPEYTDWEFQYLNDLDQRCRRFVILNGEVTNFIDEKAPMYTDEYDANDNECIRYYFCEDDAGNVVDDYTRTDEPSDYGDWDYDGDVCYREVICFGEQNSAFDYNEAEPQINWFEYDDGIEECIGYLYCDEDDDIYSPADSEDMVEGDAYIEWTDVDIIKDRCIGTVYCGDEEQELDEETYMPSDIVEVEYDEDDILCIIHYECDNEEFTEEYPIDTDYSHTAGGIEYCYIICKGIQATDDPVVCPDGFTNPDDDSSYSIAKNNNGSTGGIEVYPNPFNTQVHLTNLPDELLSVAIYNSTGTRLEQIQLEGENHSLISTENLISGIYFIIISDLEGTVIKKEKLLKL